METERTPLRNENIPHYVILTNHARRRKNKIRKFQCCICATLLSVFVMTLVVTISYSTRPNENSNSSSPNASSLETLVLLSWPLQESNYSNWDEPFPNAEEVKSALDAGQEALKKKEAYEAILPAMELDSPSFRHQLSTKTLPKASQLAETGYVFNVATIELQKRRTKKRKPIGRWQTDKTELLPKEICDKKAENKCELSPYRTTDGSCNNLEHPRSWGVAMRPFRRILLPDYADGISAPRKAVDGSSLPSAREISTTVHRPFYRDDPNFTVMLAVWGQFVDHDMTATALSQGEGNSAISCCFTYLQAGIKQHPECYTVPIESPDPFYIEYNVTCIEFVRSAPAPTCSFGPREQMNQASNFLDGSVVYGSSDQVANDLRTFQGGELKMLIAPSGEELLPVSMNLDDGCNREEEFERGRYCFLSGDPRANENLHIASLHLLFARHHNLLARKLSQVNPGWTDEKLFQEARKIIGAQIQHITYSEFLPVVIPRQLIDGTDISIRNGYFYNYDSSINPSIANSFATSVFRFGHSLLPGLMKLIGNDTTSEEYVELHRMLFNPFGLYDKNFLEKIMKGAMNTPVLKVDPYFNEELTEHLFERKAKPEKPKNPCGLDLVSLNIQRGRDHGLPGYPEWRRHCGLERPRNFEDLRNEIDPGVLTRLKKLYKSVDDVDMYTGALAEIPLEGGLVGPTVACLLTDQFYRLKFGDRFWYETTEAPQAFTEEQLFEIKKTTLAKIICDTSNVEEAQPSVMRRIGKDNERKSCAEIPQLDLNAWKENNSIRVKTLTDKSIVKTADENPFAKN